MNETIHWIILVVSLAFLYGVAYFIFINTSTGKPIFGIIPEILVYIAATYFITSFFIDALLNDISNKNVKLMLGKALILLLQVIFELPIVRIL
ncbi:hypothetical protein [Acinetobacter sp. SAAs470]|uniref:hypothetical protein n=1 Tax=Acinetobacter sp. SAAs470 TaxID=3036709 RepID=UPI0029346EC9|nr:hypothetical protein [Acinetobacter sp. SAAs470]WOE33217.1 hypothetical protein QSG84_05490 [Acinetobacter sp. SAAs470]WOE39946.1 hypothetical protein QSG86_14545 [Acinetobacter sp. SAAs474]